MSCQFISFARIEGISDPVYFDFDLYPRMGAHNPLAPCQHVHDCMGVQWETKH
jgi:hypothetical protein